MSLQFITGTRSQMAPGIVVRKQQKSAGDDQSTMALKPVGKVIRSPKQRVLVAPRKAVELLLRGDL